MTGSGLASVVRVMLGRMASVVRVLGEGGLCSESTVGEGGFCRAVVSDSIVDTINTEGGEGKEAGRSSTTPVPGLVGQQRAHHPH